MDAAAVSPSTLLSKIRMLCRREGNCPVLRPTEFHILFCSAGAVLPRKTQRREEIVQSRLKKILDRAICASFSSPQPKISLTMRGRRYKQFSRKLTHPNCNCFKRPGTKRTHWELHLCLDLGGSWMSDTSSFEQKKRRLTPQDPAKPTQHPSNSSVSLSSRS